MNRVEEYLGLLRDIYGDDIVKGCIKEKNEKLYVNKDSKYFKCEFKGLKVPYPDICTNCSKNKNKECGRALPGWKGELKFSKEDHIREFLVISQNPEPDRFLVTSYRVGLNDNPLRSNCHDPKNRFGLIKTHLETILEGIKFDVGKAYFTDEVKCNTNEYSTALEKFRPYLCKEIMFIKPKWIIANGTYPSSLEEKCKFKIEEKYSTKIPYAKGKTSLKYMELSANDKIKCLKLPHANARVSRETLKEKVSELIQQTGI